MAMTARVPNEEHGAERGGGSIGVRAHPVRLDYRAPNADLGRDLAGAQVTAAALNVQIAGAVAAALLMSRGRGGPDARAHAKPRREWSPAGALAVVICLIYLNQVLFTVYVLRVHDGNPAFVARYLPDGWFAIAHGAAIETLARHFPASGLLAAALAAGLAGAACGVLASGGHTEARLLWAAAGFFGCAVSVCALIDRLTAKLIVRDARSSRRTA